MPLSPLRPPAAPVHDAPRKISTPLSPTTPPAPHSSGLHKGGSVTRPSNPALQASTGASGFDPSARTTGPRISLPATGAPQPTAGTSAVGATSGHTVAGLFNKGSSSFEKILGSLGHKDLPPIEDPTARLQQRSDYLGSLLQADPSLKNQISKRDLFQAMRISKAFSDPTFYGSLDPAQKQAVDSYQNTMSMMCAEWPPPPGRGGYGNG